MSITAVFNPAPGDYQQIQSVQKRTTSDGNAPGTEAAQSTATKIAQNANVGVSPKTITAQAVNRLSVANNLSKLKMLASQHLTAGQIAERLGISVSAVMKEAASAGLKLSTGSTDVSSVAVTANLPVGNNVDVKV